MNNGTQDINKYLLQLMKNEEIKEEHAYNILKAIHKIQKKKDTSDCVDDIAVIGISCLFPNAKGADEYWNNLINQIQNICKFPNNRINDMSLFSSKLRNEIRESHYKAGYLNEIFDFDPSFFRISPKESICMDPVQRLFLRVAYEAMEDGGYGGDILKGSNTGVFVGMDTTNSSLYRSILDENNILSLIGALTSIIASRLAYIFDLRGPALVVDTACSSGLVAVHQACMAIKNKDCNMAIAGGVNVVVLPQTGVGSSEIESGNSKIKVFDRNSNGTLWGEGVGALLLKPLANSIKDRDNIYAVIKGSAINNDGASNGITAPKMTAQVEVIDNAWKKSKISPNTIKYIETHGTGTLLGDPVELKGITEAFKKYTTHRQFCGVGSVKTNIGHTVAASGIASLIKVVLALKNRKIPATLNFEAPNPLIDFDDSPVYIVDKLTQFEMDDDNPLRAGVSSFGFSGTNCHMVLEQSPEIPNFICINNVINVFTISAKTYRGIKTLINQYKNLLSCKTDIRIQDICNTVNTGRGHYNFRLVIVSNNTRELLNKLKILSNTDDLNKTNVEGTFFAEHKVILKKKGISENGEISEDEKKTISLEANGYLNKFIKADKLNEENLFNTCLLYVKGADVDWGVMYKDSDVRKISLPTYPFDNKKYLPKPISQHESDYKKNFDHYLIHTCISTSINQDVYLSLFSVEKDWVLHEHKIVGRPTIPGVTYLEIVRAIGERYFDEGYIELRDVVFLSPLYIDDNEVRSVQTVIDKANDYLQFNVVSRSSKGVTILNDRWTTHATGKICRIIEKNNCIYDIDKLKKQLDKTRYSYEVSLDNPRTISTDVFEWGSRWDNIKEVYIGENDILLELVLPNPFLKDLEGCWLHPSLLDNAVNWVAFNMVEGTYLPLAYKSLKIFDSLKPLFYVYIKNNHGTEKSENQKRETLYSDILLLDSNGQVIVDIEHYSIKKVHNMDSVFKRSNDKMESLYHGFKWVLKKENKVKFQARNVNALLVGEQNILCRNFLEHLVSAGRKVLYLEISDKYEELSEYHFKINGSYDEIYGIVEKIKEQGIGEIYHLTSYNTQIQDEDKQCKRALFYGTSNIYYIIKSLIENKLSEYIRFVIIANYANKVTADEKIVIPYNSAIMAMGNVINQEYPNIECQCIDIDDNTDIEDIMSEIQIGRSGKQVVFRNGKRYVEQLVRINLDEVPDQQIEFKDTGVYIITGGTGGIGLEVSRYLASKNKVNIALINRTKFPERETWDEILIKSSDDKIGNKIRQIKEIEKTGSNVFIYALDISNELDLLKMLDELRKNHGKVKGIIHCAGVAGLKFLFRKEEKSFNEVLKPKVEGTRLLHKLTKDDELDLFVMFSSTSSFLGGTGQGDYSPANKFLDSFAEYRSIQGKKTLTINWPAWKETGMAVDYNVNKDNEVFRSIETEQAIRALDKVINKQISNIIIANTNFDNESISYVEKELFLVSDDIKNSVLRSTIIKNNDIKRDLVLKGKETYEFTELERQIGSIWGQVLGIDEMDTNEDFFKMGGDSIQAIQIVNLVKERNECEINITDVFEYSTVSKFADFIKGKTSKIIKNQIIHNEVKVSRLFELSDAQKRIWFLQNFNPDMTAYNLSMTYVIDEEVELERLNQAFNIILNRQSSLRIGFEKSGGFLKQYIRQNLKYSIDYFDYSGEIDSEKSIKNHIYNECKIPFDLLNSILIKVNLYKVKERSYYLLVKVHHIISDGWSVKILTDELINGYMAIKEGRKNIYDSLSIQYIDWVANELEWKKTEEYKKYREYWLNELYKPHPVLELPYDYKRPSIQTYNGNSIYFNIKEPDFKRIKKISRNYSTTLFCVFISIYFTLIHKISNSNDIIVGIPYLGRDKQELEKIIGLFINTLCIRVQYGNIKTFKDLVMVVKNKINKAIQHSRFPFGEIVLEVNPERDLSRNPIFSTFFQLSDYIPPEQKGITQFEFSFFAKEVGEELEVRTEYNTDLFSEESVRRFTEYFKNILDSIKENPEILIRDINYISPYEEKKLLNLFDKDVSIKDPKPVHQIFFEKFTNVDECSYIVFGQERYSFNELQKYSNKLGVLLQKNMSSHNEPIGIMVERGFGIIKGIVAILNAGGCYVPIDPTYPPDRIKYILEHSEIGILITDRNSIKSINDLDNIGNVEMIVCLEHCEKVSQKNHLNYFFPEDYENMTGQLQDVKYLPDDLIYIMYTSGSTGKPKGVMVKHTNVSNFINWSLMNFGINRCDRMMLVTSISFDISVFEIFSALTSGAELHILSESLIHNPVELLEYINLNQITIWHSVPSLMLQYLTANKSYLCNGKNTNYIRHIMLGGEAWSVELAKRLKKKFPKAEITNMYGPTEATIWVSSYTIDESIYEKTQIPIGKAISNNRILILDRNLKMCGTGIAGDIYVCGENTSLGYYKDEQKTSASFILHDKYGLIYKTGDKGKILQDGNYEYLGRNDGMAKIRGYRIEVGEIENVLMEDYDIKLAAVTVMKLGDSSQLVCYYESDIKKKIHDLRAVLTAKLPNYMIPSHFVHMKAIPLTPNGKIDKKALPKMDMIESDAHYVEPTNDMEELLQSIWQKVLKIDKIGIDDNFFLIGGNSLSSIELEVELEKYNFKIAGVDIFKYNTIRLMSAYIKGDIYVDENNINITKGKKVEENISMQLNTDINTHVNIIRGIEPFNDLFFKNCFYNSSFPVLNYYNKSLKSFLVNDIVLYVYQKADGISTFGVEYHECKLAEELLVDEGLEVIYKFDTNNLIVDTVSAISQGLPIIVWVDCFYETIRPEMFNKLHWPHTLLIYGYDEKKKVFNIIEHMHKDNLYYEKMTIGFNELLKCVKGYQDNFSSNSNDVKGYYGLVIKSHNVTLEEESNYKRYIENLIDNINNNVELINNSLKNLAGIIEYFKSIFLDEDMLNKNISSVLEFLNDSINARTIEKFKMERVFGSNYLTTNDLDLIIEKWKHIRGVIAKYMYSHNYRKENMEVLKDYLDSVYKFEESYKNLILGLKLSRLT